MAKYAILSDIHANLEALSVVLEKCREVEVEKYVCLGDIVGYNADPSECLEVVRALDPAAVVKGNHDEHASIASEEMEGFNPHARKAVIWTKEQLNDEQREWLANLPYRATVQGTNITIVHATLDSPENWGYIFDAHHAADNFTYQFTQLCFCGHSHVPIAFCKKPISSMTEKPIDEIPNWAYSPEEGVFPRNVEVADELTVSVQTGFKYLFNVGSVGQPRNRDPRASFAVYDSVERRVTRYRLPYDIAAAQRKILSAGLPERLALRLETGN
ncbi:metallophosphoesterase family protein [Lentisphaerota bacterium ZTH]|nr:metallophosphoesterase family protein [Lentisphaerota bacterium]WET07426.1 metallophosphoesterase family protein [Lentisphaerota bacterium ZTH]